MGKQAKGGKKVREKRLLIRRLLKTWKQIEKTLKAIQPDVRIERLGSHPAEPRNVTGPK